MSLLRWHGDGHKKSKRKTARRARNKVATFSATHNRLQLEPLEQRRVLSVTLNTITGPDANSAFDIPSGKNLYVPVNGSDAGQTISYTASSSDPNVQAVVLTGNPTLSMTVHGTTAGNVAFSGTMTFQLFENIAPGTVQGIITQVNAGLYNGAQFYRSETSAGFQLIQGGIQPPSGTISGKSDSIVLPDEFNTAASFNSSGLLAMASAGPHTATSEFFITGTNRPLANDPQSLNFGYTIFGQILTGLDIYNDILNIPTTASSQGINYANSPVTIDSASIISDTQNAVLQISAPNNFAGNATITVTGTGSDTTTAQKTFSVVYAAPVTGSPEAPPLFLSPVVNQTTPQNTPVSFQVTGTGASPTFTVTDANDFGGTHAPTNVTVQVTPGSGNTATITLTPTTGFSGTLNLIAHADASSLHDAQAFTLTVSSQVSITTVTTPINQANKAITSASGTAQPNASIALVASDGVHQISAPATTADGTGAWSVAGFDVSTLNDGTITYTVTATDTSNGVSQNSKTTTKDTVNPVVAITSPATTVNKLNFTSITVSGTGEAGSNIALTASDGTHTATGQTTVGSGGTWSIGSLNLNNLNDGPITYTAVATDAANNTGSATQNVTKDIASPAVAITTATSPINLSNTTAASASGTTEVGATVSLVVSDGTTSTAPIAATVAADGTWTVSSVNLSTLKDGTITYTATSTDAANNTAQATFTATKATVLLTVVTTPINAVNVKNLSASGTGQAGASITVVATDGTSSTTVKNTTVAADGTWSVSGIDATSLADGTITFTATASNGTGGTAQSSKTVSKATAANATLSGTVYVDLAAGGTGDSRQVGFQGVILMLSGTDGTNALPSRTTTTASDGTYQFANLPAGTYTITEALPSQISFGASKGGSLGGTPSANKITAITVGAGASGTGYNFSQLPLTAPQISINLFLASTPTVAQYFTNLASAGLTSPIAMSITKTSADPTSAATVSYSVAFNESVTGVDTSDFFVVPSAGITGASVASVTGSGSSYTVTVNTGTGSGTLGLSLVDDDSIVSGLGAALGGTGAGNDNFTGPAYTINGSTVTTVNHAPQGTNNTITTVENTAHTFTVSDFGFSDPNDSPADNLAAVEITTVPSAGSLTDNGVAVTAGQFVTLADITGGLLKFTPGVNATGSPNATFTFQVQDDGGTGGGGVNLDPSPKSMTINVTAINSAPTGANNTITTNENAAHTFTVADFGFSDPNDSPANTLSAVMITTLPTAGSLTDNGVAVTLGQFIPLADITGNLLKFTPAANANGAAYSTFTFQVQDNGGTAGGGVNLDPSPKTMTVNVTANNSPPAGADTTITTDENAAHTFSVADFGFSDVNDTPANNLLAVKIAALPTAGSLTDNGVAVTAGQVITLADITGGLLQFTPANNASGSPYTTFTFQVQDDGGTANGGVDLDPTPNTITINVSPPNSAPAGTDKTISTTQDTTHAFSAADFGFTDPNDTPPDTLLAVKITTLPTAGTLTNNGVAVVAGDSISLADITGSHLVFTPVAGAVGSPYSTFTFQVQDNGGTANGGVDLDQSPNTITLNVTPPNHAPAGANNSFTFLENASFTFALANFGFTDANDTPPNNFSGVMITTLPAHGTLADNGVPVTSGQFVPAADISAGLLKFTPALNGNGNDYGDFTFQVRDDGGTSGAGVDTDPTPRTMKLNVASVNNAPAGTDATISTTESTDHTFTAADFGFTDPDDPAPNSLLAVTITTLPTHGTLTLNGVAVTLGQSVSADDINNSLFKFTPVAGETNSPYTSFTFQVQDDGGTNNGGVDLDQSPNTLTINVTPPNNAPAGTDKTISTTQNTPHTFTAADFGFTDANDTPPNTLLAVKITTLPTSGTLTDDGVAVVAGNSISLADITGNKLVFTPSTDQTGSPYTTFTFQVQDNGGTANGGVDLDQSPNTITINVTTPNHAPAGANNSFTILENATFTFASANFGFTDASDIPPNNFSGVVITTLPAHGTLTDNGVPVTAGQFVPAADISGSLLKFTPALNGNGNDYGTFTFQVRDDGGTGGGGMDTDPTPRTMKLNVTSVNNAPVGTDNSITTTKNTDHTFTAADFGFTDPDDPAANSLLAVKITTLPTAGTLTDDGVAVTAGEFIPLADITGNLLKFTPVNNATGSPYTTFTFQVQDDGGTNNGGVDLDQSPNTMTINVTLPNSAPAGADKTISMTENTAHTFTAADFGFTDANDTPPNTLLAVKITTLPTAGSLTDNGTPVVAGDSIPLADITGNHLVFTPVGGATGSPYATLTFQVQDNGGTDNGGVDLDQSPNTITFNVTPLNHAPAGANNSFSILENASFTFSVGDFGFSDANDTPPNALANVKITTLPAHGTLADNGVPVTLGQFVSVADISGNLLKFTPALNGNGNGYGTFTFQVQDNGGVAGGGIDLDPTPRTMKLSVTSVNNAPAGADATISTTKNTDHTFTAADFGFTDPDDPAANSLMDVKITTLPTAGTLKDNGVAVTLGQFVSVDDINNGLLKFSPAADATGSPYTTFTFQVQDDGGTSNGGVDLDPSANTITINVTPPNNAPAGANHTVTMDQDTSHTFTVAEFGFTDASDTPPNTLLAVKITTAPAAGTLTDNGVAVVDGDSISLADITGNKLVFTPAGGATGSPYTTFTFQVQDNGGTDDGGADLDPTPRTMTIDVAVVAPLAAVPTFGDLVDQALAGEDDWA